MSKPAPLCTCGLPTCSYCADTALIARHKRAKTGTTSERVDSLRALLASGVSSADRRFDRD